METRYISKEALAVIDQYKNFKIGSAICSIPYFNNNHKKSRGSLAVHVGKGSPKEIFEEVEDILIKEKIDKNNLNSASLKKILVDNDLGIDCSGFIYHVLGRKSLEPVGKNILTKIKAKISPAKNIDVKAFADERNSKIIALKDVESGDIVTTIGERNHIILIYKIDYENSENPSPKTIYYVHSMAWPTDGQYDHGIHEGKIDIVDINKSILEQNWDEKYTYLRAKESLTELRRLRVL